MHSPLQPSSDFETHQQEAARSLNIEGPGRQALRGDPLRVLRRPQPYLRSTDPHPRRGFAEQSGGLQVLAAPQDEIARLRLDLRHLRKDVLLKEEYIGALRRGCAQVEPAPLLTDFPQSRIELRYRIADRVNEGIKRWAGIHRLVKRTFQRWLN